MSYFLDISFIGVLVDAMRKGYWIILDELNLAPSDVLEALNRVLCKCLVVAHFSLFYASALFLNLKMNS